MKLKDLGKNIVTIAVMGSALTLASCKKNNLDNSSNYQQPKQETKIEMIAEVKENEIKTLEDVLKYIKNNPEQQELVLNYVLDLKDSNLPYSAETMGKFSNIIRQEIEACPEQMRDYILKISGIGLRLSYKNEIGLQLTEEEKWEIFSDASIRKTGECIDESKKMLADAYNKFRETRLHDRLEETGKKVKDSMNKGIKIVGTKLSDIDRSVEGE